MRILSFFVFLFCASTALAQVSSQNAVIKRVVVFPIRAEKDLQKAAEETWWDLREKLTENKRFLIASKNYMEVKDVYQPRGELLPADAIILGRLLDSHALVTTVVRDGEVRMQAYETQSGTILWQKRAAFNPTTPASKQLQDLSVRLIYDFVASVPYHGSVIIDALSGRTVFQEGEKNLFRADVGVSSAIVSGATVQVIRLNQKSLKPQFEEGVEIEILAEGRVVKVENNIITAELVRAKAGYEVTDGELVRIPEEFERLQKSFSLKPSTLDVAGTQLLIDKQIVLTEKEKQKKPL
ncbi:MAG: hypothetical protein AABZ31_05765, partial [Bdellovibrionota bacterium]